MEIYKIYKRVGETPLESIGRLRREKDLGSELRFTYAGRLDPMAEGLLLILSGATQEDKNRILDLPKKYYFEVLWGFESDSHDVLGMVEKTKKIESDLEKIDETLEDIKQIKEMDYPVFSSRPVSGKPLFKWAKEGKIKDIEIPKRDVNIFSIEKIKDYEISSSDLLSQVSTMVNSVNGDFRQEEILNLWRNILEKNKDTFLISCFEANVSSGTYIRNIASILGKRLGSSAICFKIVREEVGDYKLQ